MFIFRRFLSLFSFYYRNRTDIKIDFPFTTAAARLCVCFGVRKRTAKSCCIVIANDKSFMTEFNPEEGQTQRQIAAACGAYQCRNVI